LTKQEVEELKKVSVPMHDKVQAIFNSTCALDQLSRHVVHLMTGMINRSPYEEAVVGTYYRMALWMQSLVKLAAPIHIQAAASAARSMFELLIDVKRLVTDHALAEAYHDFTFVRRFNNARLEVEHRDKVHGVDPTTLTHERKFLANPKNIADCDAYRTKHGWVDSRTGKPNWPDHWDKGSAFDRAGLVTPNYQDMYREAYGRLCWYMHAGLVGFSGISEAGLEAGFGWIHTLCQRLIYDATEVVCTEFNFFKIEDGLRIKLKDAKNVMGESLIKALLAAKEVQDAAPKP
jgi:hypothetical protein